MGSLYAFQTLRHTGESMNLKNMKDSKLLKETEKFVSKEKAIMAIVLEHLYEIYRRRLYSDEGYESLFKYLVHKLKYSEGEAVIRVSAVMLMHKTKYVCEKIASGQLTLTNASMLNTAINNKEHETGEIIGSKKTEELINSILDTPTRKADREIREELKLKPKSTINLRLGRRVLAKIERLRIIYGDISEVEIFEILLDEKIRESSLLKLEDNSDLRSKKGQVKDLNSETDQVPNTNTSSDSRSNPKTKSNPKSNPKSKLNPKPNPKVNPDSEINKKSSNAQMSHRQEKPINRYIPDKLKKQIWKRAGKRCENYKGEKRCGGRRNLQIDHINPFAQGGDNTIENLRLLCSSCNQREAIKAYGRNHMEKFL